MIRIKIIFHLNWYITICQISQIKQSVLISKLQLYNNETEFELTRGIIIAY